LKIQYCSDLHLEFEQNNRYLLKHPLSVCGEVLILAGDVVPIHDELLKNPFFNYISDNYKRVFWVPGNHEFYHRDVNEFSKSMNIQIRSNVHLVNNAEIEFENIRFIFSTLWSKISPENEKNIEQSVSDFDCILKKDRKLKATDFNKLHEESLEFIKQSLSKNNRKTVVVTHHLPSKLCNLPAHNKSQINEAFCVDLTKFIESGDIGFWIYGHSHFNQKPIYIGKTLLLTNQLGYVHCNEHEQYRQKAYFSI
jgi:Icc-related predicted phosphoesterase